MSKRPFVSFATRFVAPDVNATRRPLPVIDGDVLSPFTASGPVAVLARTVRLHPEVRSATATPRSAIRRAEDHPMTTILVGLATQRAEPATGDPRASMGSEAGVMRSRRY